MIAASRWHILSRPSPGMTSASGVNASLGDANHIAANAGGAARGSENLLVPRQLRRLPVLLAAISLVYLGANLLENSTVTNLVNQLLPPLYGLAFLLAGYSWIRSAPLVIWTPAPWFLVVSGIYFGFGPLLHYLGSETSVWIAHKFFPVDEMGLLRTNLLNATSSFLVVSTFLAFPGAGGLAAGRSRTIDLNRVRAAVILFLALGIPVKYLLALPYEFGFTSFVLPGSILYLTILPTLAIVPMTLLAREGSRSWRVGLYALIAVEVLVSLLQFSKLVFLRALLMVVLGLFLYDNRPRTLVYGALVVALAYLLITPLIPYGRQGISEQTGTIYQADLRERYEIARQYFAGGPSAGDNPLPEAQAWWTRLNYANAQAFAMKRYDEGLPGRSFESAILTLVPRFLWPDKPVISDVGLEFNYLATGNPKSASSPGFAAEAYWNGGWWSMAITSVFVGLVFVVFFRYSTNVMLKSRLEFLPVVFAGLTMGLRPDGWFVLEFPGTIIIAFVLHWMLRLGGAIYEAWVKGRAPGLPL